MTKAQSSVKTKVKVTAIMPAAGSGSRMHMSMSKALIPIGRMPLAVRTLKALQKAYAFDCIVTPVEAQRIKYFEKLFAKWGLKKIKVVAGGKTRGDSVRLAFEATPKDNQLTLIHDMARPFIGRNEVRELIRVAAKKKASVLAEKSKATVKETDAQGKRVVRTLNRERIFLAQTPQVFQSKLLLKSYQSLGKRAARFTDEASLVEAMGTKVYIVEGHSMNIKITTREDLKMAEAIASLQEKS